MLSCALAVAVAVLPIDLGPEPLAPLRDWAGHNHASDLARDVLEAEAKMRREKPELWSRLNAKGRRCAWLSMAGGLANTLHTAAIQLAAAGAAPASYAEQVAAAKRTYESEMRSLRCDKDDDGKPESPAGAFAALSYYVVSVAAKGLLHLDLSGARGRVFPGGRTIEVRLDSRTAGAAALLIVAAAAFLLAPEAAVVILVAP